MSVLQALPALRQAPGHERAWATGASGEERVAEALAKRCGCDIALLHDRRMPGSRANIDHLAVSTNGVWVIDAKRYRDRRVSVQAPLLGQAKLLVGGSDKTKLAEALSRQVAAVRAVVDRVEPRVPIESALCFVDADWPLLGRRSFHGHLLTSPRRLAKHVCTPGQLPIALVERLAHALDEAFPSYA